jgi:cytochrome c oxidase assembly protein subunit 15
VARAFLISGKGPIAAGETRARRQIALWLVIVAAMVFLMVVVGGATRLTQSGLSMVEWRPVTGWLPPLDEKAWQEAFDAYRQYPEYRHVNAGMTLAGFKEIFWLEYVHRLLGRLIGVAFAIPFLVFVARRWVDRRLAAKLALLLMLGGLQGALGWYMVQSGLIDRPDVSQYRLVAHLGVAFLIYAGLLWIAFDVLQPSTGGQASGWPARLSLPLCALVLLTALSGGFVAGTDAGFAYNTFPTMDGELVPARLFALKPWYLSFFEDITTIQFTHRLLATLTLMAVVGFAVRARARPAAARLRSVATVLAVCTLAQYALGISTLVLIVPVPLGVAHQAGAMVVWTVALWLAFEARRTPDVVEGGAGRSAGPIAGRNHPATAARGRLDEATY